MKVRFFTRGVLISFFLFAATNKRGDIIIVVGSAIPVAESQGDVPLLQCIEFENR